MQWSFSEWFRRVQPPLKSSKIKFSAEVSAIAMHNTFQIRIFLLAEKLSLAQLLDFPIDNSE